MKMRNFLAVVVAFIIVCLLSSTAHLIGALTDRFSIVTSRDMKILISLFVAPFLAGYFAQMISKRGTTIGASIGAVGIALFLVFRFFLEDVPITWIVAESRSLALYLLIACAAAFGGSMASTKKRE